MSWLKRCLLSSIFLIALAVSLLGHRLLAGLPSPRDLPSRLVAPSTKIYDRHGRLLYEVIDPRVGKHSPLPLEEIPLLLRQATVATEDASFYSNPGVDLRAIVRALLINLRGGEVLAGGSTITQQVARNLLLSPRERAQRTLLRKMRESILAWQLARSYSKDRILELYLNQTYYGHFAYGVEAAAQAYFGKHVHELDLAEMALLAGLPQSPVLYNPLENPEAARKRQAVVLDLMVKNGYITREEAELAKKEPLRFAATPFTIKAPHFVMYVQWLLEQEMGEEAWQRGGWRVYTTLDLDLQEVAEEAVRRHLANLARCLGARPCPPGGHRVRNAALVALDPHTGEILAMVGSPDYFDPSISGAVNATLALRQPGSSIKPITYAAALATGRYTPATVLLDERTVFITEEGTPYVPVNYDLRFHGPVPLREALGSSYNVPAVKVLDDVGIDTVLELARRLGITTLSDAHRFGLTLTLGGGEVRLLELVAAYAAFANEGRRVEPLAVLRVEDEKGRVLREWKPKSGEQVLDPRVAFLITDILSDDEARIPSFGEGSVLRLSRPAAVKTGTTTDWRDNWTVGYTPQLVAGVWVGNADNEPMLGVSGISGAAPIWHDFMEEAHKGLPPLPFPKPPGLVQVEVCALSGLLPNPYCPHRRLEWFIAGTEPRERCAIHGPGSEARKEAIRLLSPDPGSTFRLSPELPLEAQAIEVAAEVEGPFRQVVFYLDGHPWTEFQAPPYRKMWKPVPGEHEFLAVALDEHGRRVQSQRVRIKVEAPAEP